MTKLKSEVNEKWLKLIHQILFESFENGSSIINELLRFGLDQKKEKLKFFFSIKFSNK